MKTKFVILLITLSMLFACLPAMAFIDTEGTQYQVAVDTLTTLGIIEGMSADYFEPEGSVTRAQMTAVAVRLLGTEAHAPVSIFEDVPTDHWAAGVIAAGHKMGIINGMSETVFAPEEAVTFSQAVKMIVCVLGYDVQAKAQGGFPAGYLAVASQMDLLSGVSEKMHRGDMAQLVYNALDTPLFEGVSFSDEGITAYNESEKTILSAYLHLTRYEGKVLANSFESLNGTYMPSGRVSIGGEILYPGTTDIAEYIGREVVAYAVKTDGEDYQTVVTFRTAKRLAEKELLAKQVLPKTTKTRLYYQLEDGTEERDFNIASDAVLLYNGAEKKDWTAEDLQPKNGTVTLLANNGQEADSIIVWEYVTYIVTDRDEEQNIIYVRDLQDGVRELTIPEGNTSKAVHMLNADGNAIAVADFSEDAVVSAAFDTNGVLRKLVLSSATVLGTVTEISDEIVINETAYVADETLLASVNVGDSGLFYLDFTGRPVLLDETAQPSWKYGYIVSLFQNKGLDAEASAKIFTQDGVMEVFPLADTMEVNDLQIKNEALFVNSYTLTDAQKIALVPLERNGVVKEQLIRYEVNGKGAISVIKTANDSTGLSEEERNNTFTCDWTGDIAMYLGHTLKSFNSRHMMTDSSLVFRVATAYTGENDDEYAVQKIGNLVHAEIYNNVKMYDLSEYNDIGVLLLQGAGAVGKNLGEYALVTGIGQGLTEDGMICETIRVFDSMSGAEVLLYNENDLEVYFRGFAITKTEGEEGEKVEKEVVNEAGIQLKETIPVSALRPGDIIKYQATNGIVTSMTCMFRAETPLEGEWAYDGTAVKYTSSTHDYYPTLYLYTKAKKVSNRTVVFDTKLVGGETVERVHVFSSAPVIIFDTEEGTWRRADAAAMREGDMFFAARNNPYERLIVIYR